MALHHSGIDAHQVPGAAPGTQSFQTSDCVEVGEGMALRGIGPVLDLRQIAIEWGISPNAADCVGRREAAAAPRPPRNDEANRLENPLRSDVSAGRDTCTWTPSMTLRTFVCAIVACLLVYAPAGQAASAYVALSVGAGDCTTVPGTCSGIT